MERQMGRFSRFKMSLPFLATTTLYVCLLAYQLYLDYLENWHQDAFFLLLSAGIFLTVLTVAHLRRSRGERRLRASEMRFRHLTMLSSDWYWEQDSEFRFTRIEGDPEVLSGIAQDDQIGLARWDRPALNLSAAEWDAHKATLQSKVTFHDFEMRRPDHNGQERWVAISGLPIFDERGDFRGYRGVGKDITERMTAQAKVRQTVQLLRSAIDAIDEAFVLYDADDRLVFCNGKYRQIYASVAHLMVPGVGFETLLRAGAEAGQYGDAVGRIDDWVAERMAAHHASNSTIIQRHDNGRVLRIIERKLSDGHIVGFRIDITDLVQATKDAQAANLAKSRFLATMSHEIRTPMNGILGMAQLLLRPDLPETRRDEFARIILSSGQTLLALLNDILDLSKIEAGKFQLDPLLFEPEDLICQTQALFASLAQAKNLEILCKWRGPIKQRYLADAHRVRQMLSNLLGNAIKFTAKGTVRMEGLELECTDNTALLEFSVSDSGIGIEAEKLDLLFKPFSQADSSTTRIFGGTGLGLSIVSNIARAMGGEVGVQSVPGKGSRFWFRVRAQHSATDQERLRIEVSSATANALSAEAATPVVPLDLRSSGKTLDRREFDALVTELLPYLEQNKFTAIARFRALQVLVAGTELAHPLGELQAGLESLRFDWVLEGLQHIVASRKKDQMP
jgi:PAS domain S-box-containing protein